MTSGGGEDFNLEYCPTREFSLCRSLKAIFKMGKIFMPPMRIPPAVITGWNATFMNIKSAPLLMGPEIPFENITLLHDSPNIF